MAVRPYPKYNKVELVILVVEHFEATVGYQYTRNAEAFWCLVVLNDSGYDTWKSQSRAIECVADLYILGVIATETAVQAVGLITLKV